MNAPTYTSDAEKRQFADALRKSEQSLQTWRDTEILETQQLELALSLSKKASSVAPEEDEESLQRALALSQQEERRRQNEYDAVERQQLQEALEASLREGLAQQRYEDDDSPMQELHISSPVVEPLLRRFTTAPSSRPARPLPTPPSGLNRAQSASAAMMAKPVFVSPHESEEDPFSDSFEVSNRYERQTALSLPEIVEPLSRSAPTDPVSQPHPTLRHHASAIIRRQPSFSASELDLRNRQLTEEIAGVKIGFQAVNDEL
jgi:hypothetical protein